MKRIDDDTLVLEGPGITLWETVVRIKQNKLGKYVVVSSYESPMSIGKQEILGVYDDHSKAKEVLDGMDLS